MEPLTRIVSVTAFPLVLGGAIAAALLWQTQGGNPADVAGGLAFAAGILVALLERVFPHHRSWLHSKGDLAPDIAYVVTIGLVSALLVPPLVAYSGVALFSWLSHQIAADLWPTSWPLLAQLPLALVVAELPKYWHHRLQHNVEFLWRFHATHHSAPRLYWLNAARFHPIDILIDGLLGGVALVSLGVSAELIALFGLVSAVHGYFQHANLELRLGPLNYFFSMAELHRWHHAKTLTLANHNYGQNVIFWDLVFGSFFWPKDQQPPEDIGIPDFPNFPMKFWQQLATPFTWSRLKQQNEELAR